MQKKNNNKLLLIEAIVVVLGLIFLSYNYVTTKKTIAFDYMNQTFFAEKEKLPEPAEIIDVEVEEKEEYVEEEIPDEVPNYYYIGYLEIPKINLKKGFVDINSSDNDVEKNIQVIAPSNYPDVEKGNLILAGHSGTGYKAFFNNLYKLQNGDLAYVTYQNIKYTYRIVDIYKLPKTGKIGIFRDYDKTALSLITCTNHDDTTQTIYIAEQIEQRAI